MPASTRQSRRHCSGDVCNFSAFLSCDVENLSAAFQGDCHVEMGFVSFTEPNYPFRRVGPVCFQQEPGSRSLSCCDRAIFIFLNAESRKETGGVNG